MNYHAAMISKIKRVKKKLSKAKELKCTCSSFFLQYEGYCECLRGRTIREAETELHNIIEEV